MAFRPPSLRALVAFEAAARLGSFARVAHELKLTASAVSHAVRSLESRQGTPLFIRKGGSLALTAEGVALAGRVRRSLVLLDEAFDSSQTTPSRSRLLVSALHSFAEAQLAPRLNRFMDANVDTDIELSSTSRMVDLAAGEADIGIRFGTGQWPGLSSALIARETLYPVASPHYRNGALPKAPQELASCSIIAHPDVPWRLWMEAAGCAAVGSHQLTVDNVPLALAAAVGGAGVALARDKIVRPYLDQGRLVRLFGTEIRDDYAYWAVWHGGSPKVDRIRRLVAWLVQEFGEPSAR